jgi:hypothetical protein
MGTLGAWILFVLLWIPLVGARRGSGWCKRLQYALTATAIALVVDILALEGYLYTASSRFDGVIIAAEVGVTSGPGWHYVTEFTLCGGAEVRLVEVRGNWARLSLPSGELEGWVPASTVERVDR